MTTRTAPTTTARRRQPVNREGLTTFHLLGDLHVGSIADWRLDSLVQDEKLADLPEIDGYIQLGDQVNDALESQFVEYEHFTDHLTRAPIHEAMGNHDAYGIITPAAWAARLGYSSPDYGFDVGDVHVTVISGKGTATASDWADVSPTTLAFLDADLTANSSKPCFIACHFPIWDTVLGDSTLEYNSRAFGFYVDTATGTHSSDVLAVIAAHPQVVGYLSGHTHSHLEVPGLVVPVVAGSVRFAHVNASCLWYCGKRATGQSYGDATDPVHTSYATWTGDAVEVRYRHHGAGIWYGPNGNRVLTVDGLGG